MDVTLYLHPAMGSAQILDFCMKYRREAYFRYVAKAKVSRKPMLVIEARTKT